MTDLRTLRERYLVACVDGGPHDTGTRIAADHLEMRGFAVGVHAFADLADFFDRVPWDRIGVEAA